MSTLKHILLVEDDPDIQEVARMALESLGGFEVALASTGQEALDKFPTLHPDLVLLDVMMPGMNGPTTLARLRQTTTGAQTPVVFMTAKVQPHEVTQYKELGAIDVISKPFDPMTLSSQLLEIWSTLEQRPS